MRQDLSLNENDDLIIANGDLVVKTSDEQHVNHLLKANKGYYKEFPTTGCGLIAFIKKQNADKLIEHEISTQLNADGYLTNNLSIDNNELLNIEFDKNY